MTAKILLLTYASLFIVYTEAAWGMGGDHKKVKLTDVNVLTLYSGKMTKGRRSSPVPQLDCVTGGTAPCSAFTPKVVQCKNMGDDGYDVQWECKTDMDNAFRFGEIDVSCEGFDYPDDPYILHGSCGLRYTIDYTKEGLNQGRGHSYYGDGRSYSYSKKQSGGMSTIIADLIVYVAMGLIVYAFYKTCVSQGRHEGERAYSSTEGDYPSGGGGGGTGRGYGWFGGDTGTHYRSGGAGYYDDASCHNRRSGGTGAGGFWTGAATGGLLGYMFGNRGTGWQRTGYGHNNYGYRDRSSWFGGDSGGGFYGGSGGYSGGSSSGTRSASGFGGTSRR